MLNKIIFLPIGSYEYHGEFLPPNTDAVIAEEIAKSLKDIYKNSVILPVLNYGISTEHAGFEDTITVDSRSYLDFVASLVSAKQFRNSLVVIINGHGGNNNIIGAIESEYNYKNDDSKIFAPSLYGRESKELCDKLFGEFDTHAGSVESSLMANYGYIDSRSPVYNEEYIKKFKGSLRFFTTEKLNKEGIIKDTNKLIIDAKKGKKLHDFMVQDHKNNISELIANINHFLKSNG